MTELFWIGNVY